MVSMIVALQHPDDTTWYFSVVMVWSTTEIGAAIIALSLPALRALFGVLSKNRLTMHHSGSDNTGTIGPFLGRQSSLYLTDMMFMRRQWMWTGGPIRARRPFGVSRMGRFDLRIQFAWVLRGPCLNRQECDEVPFLRVYSVLS